MGKCFLVLYCFSSLVFSFDNQYDPYCSPYQNDWPPNFAEETSKTFFNSWLENCNNRNICPFCQNPITPVVPTEEKINHEVSQLKINRPKRSKNKSTWTKLNKELFEEMLIYERKHPNIKQCEMEKIFNVNRSSYWRWKKKQKDLI